MSNQKENRQALKNAEDRLTVVVTTQDDEKVVGVPYLSPDGVDVYSDGGDLVCLSMDEIKLVENV